MKKQINIHQHCNLKDKSAAQLQEICCEAVEKGDLTSAYHCAQHHMTLMHAGMNRDKLGFFREKISWVHPPMEDALADIHESLENDPQVKDLLGEQVPVEIRGAASLMSKFISTKLYEGALVSYLTGISIQTYVDTKGEGCIFALIDPDLCKEHS